MFFFNFENYSDLDFIHWKILLTIAFMWDYFLFIILM